MKQVQLSALAELDLHDIWHYVFGQSESNQIADRVLDGIGRGLILLGHTPLAGKPREEIGPGIRSYAAGTYMIYYRVRDRQVLVWRIIHGSREQTTALSEESES